MQCVTDSWCSQIGSTTIMVLIAFFNANLELYTTDGNCQEWAKWYLEDFHFAYEHTDGNDKLVCVRHFHTSFTHHFLDI